MRLAAFSVWGVEADGNGAKRGTAGFLGLSGMCCVCGWLHHFANVGNMVVVAVLLVGVEGAGWWNGGSPWATMRG